MKIDIESIRKSFIYNSQNNTLNRICKDGRLKQIELNDSERESYQITVGHTTMSIIRLVWALNHGGIPDGMCVTHIDDTNDHRITNLKLISLRNVYAKNRRGISPIKTGSSYLVSVNINNGESKNYLNLGSYPSSFEANKICKKYNALFGFGMEFGSLRDDLKFEEFREFVRDKITPDYKFKSDGRRGKKVGSK